MGLPCVLCGSDEIDEVIFGELAPQEKKMLHRNCLTLCLGKFIQTKKPSYRHWVFFKKDLSAEKRRFSSVKCSYCSRLGANLSCCHADCGRSFHTKCGVDNLAVLQYGGKFDCFCAEHVPEPRSRPEAEENCVLCLEPIVAEGGAFSPALAFQAPCCQNGWFHRVCLQYHSIATTYSFKCPLCRDERLFGRVANLGVSVPKWRFSLPNPPPVVPFLVSGIEIVQERAVRRGPRIANSPPVPYPGRGSRIRITRFHF